MKTSKLLAAGVLAVAIGAPIAGFLVDTNVAQPITSSGVRLPSVVSTAGPYSRSAARGKSAGRGVTLRRAG